MRVGGARAWRRRQRHRSGDFTGLRRCRMVGNGRPPAADTITDKQRNQLKKIAKAIKDERNKGIGKSGRR